MRAASTAISHRCQLVSKCSSTLPKETAACVAFVSTHMATADDMGICQRAAALIVKYDLNAASTEQSPVVHCSETCVDPTNRDGKFAQFDDVLKCGEDVAGVGHHLMYARAIVTQMPLDVAARAVITDFNDSRCLKDPRMPKVDAARVLYSASGGNTMFLFHRCVLKGSPAPGSFLTDESGSLSLTRLREVSGSFADSVSRGVPSTILSRAIRTEEPHGLSVIQAAENTKGSVQRLDHEIQIAVRGASVIGDPSIFNKIGLQGITAMMKQQVPHLANDVEGILLWVSVQGAHASSMATSHVAWLAMQHEAHIPSSRRLRGALWQCLAVVVPQDLPYIRGLLTFMCFSCPQSALKNHFCEWLSPTELKNLVSSDGWLSRARAIQTELVEKHQAFVGGKYGDINQKTHHEIMSRCENRLGRFLCKKKVDGLKQFDSERDIFDQVDKEVEATSDRTIA